MASSQSPMMAVEVAATERQQRFIHFLRYFAPALVLGYFFITTSISAYTLQNLKARGTGPRKVVVPLVCLVVISFLVESCMLLTDTVTNGARYSSTDGNVYALFSLLVWTNFTISLVKSTEPVVWYPYCGSWFIELVAEATMFAFVLISGIPSSVFGYGHLTIQACRMLILVLLSTVLFSKASKSSGADEESASLLGHDEGESDHTKASIGKSGYGAITITTNGEAADLEYEAEEQRKYQERMEVLEKRLQAEGNWFTYIKAFTIFIPFLWPPMNLILYAKLFGVGLCILCARALNLLEPRQLGIIVDRIGTSQAHLPILEVLVWVIYRWLDNSVVSQIKYQLWLPFEMYADASLNKAAYNQVMGLSRDFHTEKQSGELYKSMGHGQSLTSIVELMLFNIVPMLLDLTVAFVYLCWIFGPYMALILAATTMTYLWVSAYFIDQQTEPRRRMKGLSRRENQIMHDTVEGWNSVAYFNRSEHERDRYSGAVDMWIKSVAKWYTFWYIVSIYKDTVMEIGRICACILALYQISNGAPIGNFVMLLTYWGSFTGRLARAAEIPRQLIQYLIDAEALLNLFQKKPTVKDGGKALNFKNGAVHFSGVGFSYDGKREVIKDFSFHAQPGQRVALVGETGGGKSTILKLLFRFYDVQKGSIMIDGYDVKDVTLSSLRENIGVVPQDPTLFNESIMDNIRYARLDATDEEVMEACRAAAIHEKILTFPQGYSTRVGERGVVLSGGELQRVAIARVILKNPRIILLDEATSAVDTETETRITKALQLLTKGRTTFTVAHRLATVRNSDIVVVIKDGMIVEQGSPRELLDKKGEFAKLWLAQMEINPSPTDLESADPAHAQLGDVLQASFSEENRRSSDSSASATKSLRATAPDFVPRFQGGTSAGRDQISGEQGIQAPHNGYESGNSKKKGNKNRRGQKNKGPAAGSLPTSDAFPSESRPTTSDSKNSSQSQPESKKRGNFNPHRGKNKSEPGGPAMKNSPSDGPSDELSHQKQPRRLSAVGADAANQASSSSSGQGHRHQWHQRRRKVAQSDTLSGQASGAWSSDTLHPSTNATSSDSANAADAAAATAKDV